MSSFLRFGRSALVAMVMFATIVANASANRLSTSSRNVRLIWSSIIFETTGRSARALCPVTLEGTFHSSTIVKTLGSLVGFVTRASVKGEAPPCTGGTTSVLSASLPWHITYEGYKLPLPTFGGVILLLVGVSFQIHPSGSLACLARSEPRHPLQGIINIEAGGQATSLQPERGKSIPMTGEGGLCSFGGEGLFTEEEKATVTNERGQAVTITLI